MPTHQVELGWTVLPVPCSRVRMVTVDGPFGTKFDVPKIETAEQRMYAFADIDSSAWTAASQDAAKDCATAAIAAAGGIGAITANPGTTAAAFGEAFLACFSAKITGVAISSVHIEVSPQCMW